MTPILETERLLLRPVKADDVTAIFDCWMQDEDVSRYMCWKASSDINGAKDFVSFELGNLENSAFWFFYHYFLYNWLYKLVMIWKHTFSLNMREFYKGEVFKHFEITTNNILWYFLKSFLCNDSFHHAIKIIWYILFLFYCDKKHIEFTILTILYIVQ